MFIEIKRENGLFFALNFSDIKEVGEHITGGTYIIFADGCSLLLEQNYQTVRSFFNTCVKRYPFDFVPTGFTLMSKVKYKKLKVGVKGVKGVKAENNN